MLTKRYIAMEEGAERFEKIPVKIYSSPSKAVKAVADEIEAEIKLKAAKGEKCVLGLATGNSPVALYEELIRRHKEENLSFADVITFNLDEYLPMSGTSEQSYHHFMHTRLFDHIDIKPENTHIPDGELKSAEKIKEFCESYEKAIDAAGGIDIQILGIGRSGHIGFNEPGSSLSSRTRAVYLNDITIRDAAADFEGIANVPPRALTMGISTILKAKKIILLAWGEKKADIVRKALEGAVTDKIPATFLQYHQATTFHIDETAAGKLTRSCQPWLVNKIKWNDKLIRKAVLWLCTKVNKPILKIENKDYTDNGMSDLINLFGSANKVNIQVFNDLQHTISGWPGGKPNADDSTRPERAFPYPKRILVFSPHPDDDVISMGGTLARLVEQGHIVHVAYQTSGNIAVFDDYIRHVMEAATEFAELANGDADFLKNTFNDLTWNNSPAALLPYKGALRRVEARSACRFIHIPPENIHFLEMPFYNTGTVKKNPLTEADIDIIVRLLREIRPHQVYAAGDLADPHGTHAICLKAIIRAYDQVEKDPWFKDCYTWWYRGAWQEWDIEDVDMAVPISPLELSIKRSSIFKHESQKDAPVFPGDDPREFWQRAEARNRNTADLYNKLGMAEYEAMEVFARYIHHHEDLPF